MDDRPQPPMLRRVVITVVVAAVAFGGGHALLKYLKGLKEEPARKGGEPALPVVRVVEVRQGDHREVLRGYGVARAMRQARVSAEVGGVVREIAPDLEAGRLVAPPSGGLDGEGAPPNLAPPLVGIDPEDLEDALARLAAERAQALADLERHRTSVENFGDQLAVIQRRLDTARTELRRIVVLVPDTLPESEADRQRLAVFALEQVESELVQRKEEAQAQIAGVRARLQLLDANERKARRDLERTRVYAPFPGRVLARHVEVGALVAPGTPLFDLVDPTRVEVAIALPASRYGQVRVAGAGEDGSFVTLRPAEGAAALWEGRVVRVDPGIDSASRTFRAYVEIRAEGGEAPIAPGAHVVADVEGAVHRGVIAVPREAFLEDRVFVVEPGEPAVARERQPRIRRQLVGVALAEPGEEEGDLRDGDRVVVSNLEDISDGARLRTIPVAGETKRP